MTQPKWQSTLWQQFDEIKDKTAIKVKFGTALFFTWSLVCFGAGWLTCHHGSLDDINYTADYVQKHNPTIVLQNQGKPFCMDENKNYYYTKKSSNWTFTIKCRV